MYTPKDAVPLINLGNGCIEWYGWVEVPDNTDGMHYHVRCLWVQQGDERLTPFIDPDSGAAYDEEDGTIHGPHYADPLANWRN